LYTSDYALAHSFLIICAESNAAAPVKTFEIAVDALNSGKSAAEIYKLLTSVKRFKELLPKEAPKAVTEFANPSAVDKREFTKKYITGNVLGKRILPEQY
jgi:hypothetical protein